MIEPEAVELLESACALIVGTVDEEQRPDATRGWGAEVLGPSQVRLLLSSNAHASLANLSATGAIAVTATHFVTLVSVQLKGRARVVEPATSADRIRFDAFCAGCLHAIHELDGTPEEVVRNLVPPNIVACVVDVDAVYDQTPGPAAGARLAPVEMPS